jgi:hypothetical protein
MALFGEDNENTELLQERKAVLAFGKLPNKIHIEAVGQAIGVMHLSNDKSLVDEKFGWHGGNGFSIGHRMDGDFCPIGLPGCLGKGTDMAKGRFEP